MREDGEHAARVMARKIGMSHNQDLWLCSHFQGWKDSKRLNREK
jgi:hypothetical protein